MGLIARQVEADGIPTLSMTSALSITRSVNPPRAAFLDFPLGHTTGKARDPVLQRTILKEALAAFVELDRPGAVKMLPFRWSGDDEWKLEAMSAGDSRADRSDQPVYQLPDDRRLAEATGECATCVFL